MRLLVAESDGPLLLRMSWLIWAIWVARLLICATDCVIWPLTVLMLDASWLPTDWNSDVTCCALLRNASRLAKFAGSCATVLAAVNRLPMILPRPPAPPDANGNTDDSEFVPDSTTCAAWLVESAPTIS